MPALHQLVEGKPRCGAEIDPPLGEGHARTMWPCRECRIVELERELEVARAARRVVENALRDLVGVLRNREHAECYIGLCAVLPPYLVAAEHLLRAGAREPAA